LRFALPSGRRFRLTVAAFGLAGCAVEVVAAAMEQAAAGTSGGNGASDLTSGEIEVFVVAGTVTDRMAPAVLAAYARLPEPRLVVTFGACSNSGGPYWEGYVVTKGVDQLIPVERDRLREWRASVPPPSALEPDAEPAKEVELARKGSNRTVRRGGSPPPIPACRRGPLSDSS
jgi:Ni,Fe-hydrogenase III small subunit